MIAPDILEPEEQHVDSAWSVLKRGLADSPEMRAGLGYTVLLAIVGTAGSLLIPIVIQQILDRGLAGPDGFRPRFVYTTCAVAAVFIGVVYVAGREAFRRMVVNSETALKSIRVRTFRHIHELSLARHTSSRRGILVSRVTSDVDTLMFFMEWGALAWITGTVLLLGTLITMFAYSWRLAFVVVLSISPLVLVLRRIQRGLLDSYDRVRNSVAEAMSEISESVMGAAVIRAYGYTDAIDRRLEGAIENMYSKQIQANRYMAMTFPVTDFFGGIAVATAIGVGAWFGPQWDMTAGEVVAFGFLVSLFLAPLGEITETFDQTQTAIAAWRKVLGILDLPIDIVEPDHGVRLPQQALSVRAEGLKFAYADGDGLVLKGIDVAIDSGERVAIVGETGCGKTTFAKLLCRLADPTEGRVLIGGIDLREVDPDSRRIAIRMVPQDGFLFSTSIAENVKYGRPGSTDEDVRAAFDSLGLGWWVDRLPNGIETHVGERGDNLSVGERQLVALARAQIADPGLLILDEATSSVDPETEAAVSVALDRLAEGRTTLAIAHRLSTAERADEVLVFDRGELVERGTHRELVDAGGLYASLHRSWLGNVRA